MEVFGQAPPMLPRVADTIDDQRGPVPINEAAPLLDGAFAGVSRRLEVFGQAPPMLPRGRLITMSMVLSRIRRRRPGMPPPRSR